MTVFDARMKIDEVDFQNKIDHAGDISVVDELKLVITGQADAVSTMRVAKENALRKAHKALVKQVGAQHQKIMDQHLWWPVAADQDVKAWLEEGPIKVEA